jgi:PAS domain S-box-containing protein
MQIRHFLTGCAALAICLVLGRLVLLEVHTRESDQLDQFQLGVARIARDSAGLMHLNQVFLLYGNASTARQWLAVHEDLTRTLHLAAGYSTGLRYEVDALAETAQGVLPLFSAIGSPVSEPGSAKAGPRMEVLAGPLLEGTRRISDGAFELSEKLLDIRQHREFVNRSVTWVTMLVLAALVLGFVGVMSRRVLRPMRALERVAAAIGSGQLDARSNYRTRDEFGRLSQVFDNMAQALFERTSRLETALRESGALQSTIRLHTILSVADRAGKIIEVNDNFCRISGYSREELIGQNHRIINSGRQNHAFWTEMWRTIAAGQSWRGEICNRAKDGSPYWVDSIIAPFVGDDGRVEKYISIRFDTTAAKLFETKLQEANDRWTIAADSADIGVWEFDPQANTLLWDERMYRLYGRRCSDASEPYSLWEANVHPEDRLRSVEAISAALRGECPFETEFRILRPNGEIRHIQAKASVVRDAAGKALQVTGVNIDISDRKRTEAKLVETALLLHTVLESASDISIVAADPQLNITVFNAGAQGLLGYREEEVVGRTTPILFHDQEEVQARARELSVQIGRPLAAGAVFTEPSALGQPREWTYVRKDGSRVRVSLVVTAMFAADGGLLGYLGIAHDLTRQKQQEDLLREAARTAERLNDAKTQFLANMSHEIRTPMNAVIGLSYVLGQTVLDKEQADVLAKIDLASRSLLTLINDTLDLSKVEAGELTIEHIPFSLRQLLKDLTDVMRVHAQAKAVAFEIDAPPGLPIALAGDAMRLAQVLTNLLANAIKFTEFGSVVLRVREVAVTDQDVRLRFTVVDSGIGIAPEVQARLFTPFTQADASTTRRFGGTGLGLSIVKQLTVLMGGEVSLASTLGVGSEFSVELPFALAAPEAVARQSAVLPPRGHGLAGVRVLVADDSEINLEVARRILGLEGALVTPARNGRQVCDLLRNRAAHFDIVLMDVQMPELDGYDTTRYIRGELALTALPVIALTAGAMTAERERATAAGMNDFVTKPFDPRALLLTILRHLPAHGAPAAELIGPACEAQLAASAEPWPEIDGIDPADARQRLIGDLGLFATMLALLLDEFTGVALPAVTADAQTLASHASRMHKLRGGARLLGAKVIAELAGEAETACRAGDAARVARVTAELDTRLQALARSAAPVLAAMAADAAEVDAPENGEIDPGVVARLMELLRGKDLASLDYFSAVAPQLRQLLGKQSFLNVQRHVDNLQFKEAARALEAWSVATASAVPAVL